MRLLTADEVSDLLQIPKQHTYRLIREKKLPAVRIGKLVRVPEDALKAWVAAGGAPRDSQEASLVPVEALARRRQVPRAKLDGLGHAQDPDRSVRPGP
jgi:excisionase family DNA binding protein